MDCIGLDVWLLLGCIPTRAFPGDFADRATSTRTLQDCDTVHLNEILRYLIQCNDFDRLKRCLQELELLTGLAEPICKSVWAGSEP